MKYKVSKEELDALFREVYSTPQTEKNYTIPSLKRKEEYKFLAYKYKYALKNFLISNIPVEFSIVSFNSFTGSQVSEKNFYINGYDVEKKYRLYICASESIEYIINEHLSYDVNKLLNEKFNTQSFLDSLSETLISQLKNDFPFTFRKINRPVIQFYEDEFIKLEYKLDIKGEPAQINLLIEKTMVNSVDISPFIFSIPTTAGKRKLKKLKDILPVSVEIVSKPINISVDMLKSGQEIEITPEFIKQIR
ncbi:hypothetical protein [Persephonella sp. IF05-L8]|uniref:hypothetical protein n=1 Tax=Persephonella sp. IF05-L8 TaxID=1158338 RepID=UPI000495703C